MRKIEPLAGHDLWNVLQDAVMLAARGEAVEFVFNGTTHDVQPNESFESAKMRLEQRTGWPLLSPEESRRKAGEDLKQMEQQAAAAIAEARVPTEAEMRDAEVPWPKTLDELCAYIKTLVNRPHDYGTCVYAMSMAATAAFYHVATVLGTTGFQASCADLDIIRRTRRLKHGFRLIDYSDMLYPQYWNEERRDVFRSLRKDKDIRQRMAAEATKLLADPANRHAHEDVVRHWRRLAAGDPL